MSRGAFTPEDWLRELGAQLVMRIAAVRRVSALYEPRNSVVLGQIELLDIVCRQALESSPEVVLVALDEDLYLNGVRVPSKATHYKFVRALIEEFSRRRISGLRVQPGFERNELVTWFETIGKDESLGGAELLNACREAGASRVLPVLHVSTEAFDESGGAAEDVKAHVRAVSGTRALFQSAVQDGLELRHAKRVVQPIVDSSGSSQPVVVGLTSLKQHDEYTYAHAVNVCSVAVTMGQHLGLDRKALADLGVAALFHDVGKAAVADLVHHAIDEFDAEEWRAVRQHPLEGAKLIASTAELNATTLRCMKVALEHHLGGKDGYPAALRERQTSVLSRIVAVADTMVSFQMHRSERGPLVTPYKALAMTLNELRGNVEDALLWALVKSVGVYPPGQIVELDDGTIAMVVTPNAEDPARPSVRVLCDTLGHLLDSSEMKVLNPLPEDRVILRALEVEEYPAAFREVAEGDDGAEEKAA
jgi:HD-GYP domain-containing protein (c-di-GMP phosphodiesterase class II)